MHHSSKVKAAKMASGKRGPPMEDTSAFKSWAEQDAEAIDRFNQTIKERLEREKKAVRHFDWRGNKLPPFK